MDAIKGFQGQYRYLSNFFPSMVKFEGRTYLSSEAAYQAAKSYDGEIKDSFTKLDAREARRLGQSVVVRADWETEKLNIMYRILRAKFTNGTLLRARLLATGDVHLEETNYWHDTFWGVYAGKGENHLGRLLMVVRDELREGII
jgi:ribA/ribD-fused uncharacterized protein